MSEVGKVSKAVVHQAGLVPVEARAYVVVKVSEAAKAFAVAA